MLECKENAFNNAYSSPSQYTAYVKVIQSWHLFLSQKCSNAKNGFHTFESMHCICNSHSTSHSRFLKPEMWQHKDGLDTSAHMWHVLVNVTSR